MSNNIFAIFVPSTLSGDIKISDSAFEKRTETVAHAFCSIFGGCNVIASNGYWLADNGKLIAEKTNIVWALDLDNKVDARVRDILWTDYASQCRIKWAQYCVLVIIAGQAKLVK